MRVRAFRTRPAWAENLHEDVAPEPKAPGELPVSMKFALIYFRRNASELCMAVAKVMMAMGVEWTGSDLDQLRAMGLMERPQVGHHTLTNWGKSDAERLAREIARDYPVHVVTINDAGARSNMGAFGACACGDWYLQVGRKRSDNERLRRSAAKHIEAGANGAWTRSPPLEERIRLHFNHHLVSGAGTGTHSTGSRVAASETDAAGVSPAPVASGDLEAP